MKSIVAAVLLFSFAASAAEPYIPLPPPLLPLVDEQPVPVAEPLALSRQWWWHTIWGVLTLKTVAAVVLFGAFMIPRMAPQPVDGSGPR